MLGPATKITYGADWTEYFGHQPADGTGDVYFHLDPLWASTQHRRHRHRLLLAARRLARRRQPSRPARRHRDPHDLAYLNPTLRRRRLRLVLRRRCRARGADAHADHRRRTASPGCSATRTSGIGGRTSTTTGRAAPRAASPTAWVPQVEADLVHRARLPRGRQGREPAERLPRSESSESFLPYFSRGLRDDLIQRRYIEAFLETFDPAHGTSCPRTIRCRRSMAAGWSIPPHPCVDLGCAALSGLPVDLETLGRRRQLGARPLADRAPRRRLARRARRRHPRRLRLRALLGERLDRHARRLCHRPPDVGARRRCSRSSSPSPSMPTSRRAPCALPIADAARRPLCSRRRSRRDEDRAGAFQADARAGDGAAVARPSSPSSTGRTAIAAARRKRGARPFERARRHGRSADRAFAGSGASDRRALAAGYLGRAAAAVLRAAAEPDGDRAERRRDFTADGGAQRYRIIGITDGGTRHSMRSPSSPRCSRKSRRRNGRR